MSEKAPKAPKAPKVKTEKPEKASRKRVPHPLIGSKTGYPFTVVPADFDPKLHKPLKKKDFAEDNIGKANFIRYAADRLQIAVDRGAKKIADMRASADRIEKFGDDKKAKNLKKLEKLRAAIAALEADLGA